MFVGNVKINYYKRADIKWKKEYLQLKNWI